MIFCKYLIIHFTSRFSCYDHVKSVNSMICTCTQDRLLLYHFKKQKHSVFYDVEVIIRMDRRGWNLMKVWGQMKGLQIIILLCIQKPMTKIHYSSEKAVGAWPDMLNTFQKCKRKIS